MRCWVGEPQQARRRRFCAGSRHHPAGYSANHLFPGVAHRGPREAKLISLGRGGIFCLAICEFDFHDRQPQRDCGWGEILISWAHPVGVDVCSRCSPRVGRFKSGFVGVPSSTCCVLWGNVLASGRCSSGDLDGMPPAPWRSRRGSRQKARGDDGVEPRLRGVSDEVASRIKCALDCNQRHNNSRIVWSPYIDYFHLGHYVFAAGSCGLCASGLLEVGEMMIPAPCLCMGLNLGVDLLADIGLAIG